MRTTYILTLHVQSYTAHMHTRQSLAFSVCNIENWKRPWDEARECWLENQLLDLYSLYLIIIVCILETGIVTSLRVCTSVLDIMIIMEARENSILKPKVIDNGSFT